MLIDSHAHLNFKEYEDEIEDVIKRSLVSNTQIITIGSNLESSQKGVEIADEHDGMWAVIGCHPDDIGERIELRAFAKLAESSNKVVGIGEVGLDFFRLPADHKEARENRELQIRAFKDFIKLSNDLCLPLVLHCRGEAKDPYAAYDLMLEILCSQPTAQSPKTIGVIHCFGGNLEQAKMFIDLGFYIGVTGIVTFKNSKELQAIVKQIPLDKILIETDAPFLTPEPHRGEKNEPSFVQFVARKIAEVKGLTFEEVEKATYANTVKLFKLK